MTELVLFCVPTVIYLVVQARGHERAVLPAAGRAGLLPGAPSAYLWALLLLCPLLLASWLTIVLIPDEALETPGVAVAQLTSVAVVLGVVLRAVGEEVFFRGLLGGVLISRLGFGWGNLAQALVFLVPHLALLLVDTRLWPLLPVQFAAGWLLGWLRHRTGSLWPGAAIHALTNVIAGLIAG